MAKLKAAVLARAFSLGAGEGFHGYHCGGRAGLHVELLKDVAEVNFNGFFTHAENRRNIGVSFSLRDPKKDFGFADSEPERFERDRGAEIGAGIGKGGVVVFASALEA